MIEDSELLRRYAEEKSEPAFAELVQRHVNFVYACALRRVGGDAHLAQDVTQHVFTALARDAAALARREVLSGWLFTTARNAAAQVVRSERRRQARETEAQLMNELTSTSAHDAEWERLRPVLDDALDHLNDDDRQAVLLRFFEGKSFADVGAKLRLTENTARMRVERALDKLHALLARRGVTSTTAALGLALANQAGVAAPVGLAAAVTGAALAGGGAAAGVGAGTWTLFMGITKLQMGIAGAIVVAGATGYVLQANTHADLRREIAAVQTQSQAVAALRAENRQLAATAAEIETLRQDDAELKQLEQRVTEIRAANVEKARLAKASAQNRRKVLEDDLREKDRRLQEEVDLMNREGNKLVIEYKALAAQAGLLSGEARLQADAIAKAKFTEIQNKQREIKTFVENARRALTESRQMQELRTLPPGDGPMPVSSNSLPSVGTMGLSSGRAMIEDEQGSLSITTTGGKKELVAKNTQGAQLFSGPINTSQERMALPEDVRRRLEEYENSVPPTDARGTGLSSGAPGTWKLVPKP